MEQKLKVELSDETKRTLAKTHRWLAARYERSYEDLKGVLPKRAALAARERSRHLDAAEKLERFL